MNSELPRNSFNIILPLSYVDCCLCVGREIKIKGTWHFVRRENTLGDQYWSLWEKHIRSYTLVPHNLEKNSSRLGETVVIEETSWKWKKKIPDKLLSPHLCEYLKTNLQLLFLLNVDRKKNCMLGESVFVCFLSQRAENKAVERWMQLSDLTVRKQRGH